jgi:hypothetical protein
MIMRISLSRADAVFELLKSLNQGNCAYNNDKISKAEEQVKILAEHGYIFLGETREDMEDMDDGN